MNNTLPIMKIGGMVGKPADSMISRLSILLWGPPGIGKTTLACTMPGRKALINFDPDGATSVSHIKDLTVYDLSGRDHSITEQFKGTDPLGLKASFDHYDSYIIDSLSSIEDLTFDQGIAKTSSDSVKASIERPSQAVYLTRNNLLHHLVRVIMSTTGEAKKHICLVAHETTKVNEKDQEYKHTLALGGQLIYKVPSKVNECIVMTQGTTRKRIMVNSAGGLYSPLKTRMFTTSKGDAFDWTYDITNEDNPTNLTLSQIYEVWKANEYRKIPIPGTTEYGKLVGQLLK